MDKYERLLFAFYLMQFVGIRAQISSAEILTAYRTLGTRRINIILDMARAFHKQYQSPIVHGPPY